MEGKLLHEKAHDVMSREKRGDLLISRAMPISSRELGISGECDIVEFHRAEAGEGIFLQGQEGEWSVFFSIFTLRCTFAVETAGIFSSCCHQ